MASNREYIARFIERSFEKSVDYYMLSDKKYVVPKQKVCDYIDKVLAIPYYEFIQVSQVPNLPVLIDKFRRND